MPLAARTLLNRATRRLEAARIEDARANAEILLAHILGVSRTFLLADLQKSLSPREVKLFEKYLRAKLSGLPFEYIINQAQFCGHMFYVDRRVLIPRGETQELLEAALNFARSRAKAAQTNAKKLKVLDLCCGLACLGISWAFARAQDEVLCADKSASALAVARKNIKKLTAENADIKTLKSDLFSNIEGRFDIIISNPPYVCDEDMQSLSREVNFEPKLALRGGADGLKLIKKIIEDAPSYLRGGGLLAFEFGRNQAGKIVKFFNNDIWQSAQIKKDFNDKERFVLAVKKQR